MNIITMKQFNMSRLWKSLYLSHLRRKSALSEFPFLERTRYRIGGYILDKELAGQMVNAMCINCQDDSATWLDVNPGPGYISSALLNAGVKKLVALEHNNEFKPYLEVLESDHENYTLHNIDFFRKGPFQKNYHTFFHEITPNVRIQDFESSPQLKIFIYPGVTYEWKVTTLILNKLLISVDSLFTYGCIQFFVFLSSSEYERLTLKRPLKMNSYREKNVLFGLLFNIEVLLEIFNTTPQDHDIFRLFFILKILKSEKIQLSVILTESVSSKQKVNASSVNVYPSISKITKGKLGSNNVMYLVKLAPKQEIFKILFNHRYLPMFGFFVKEMLGKSLGRIIPRMEVYFPGCGLKLIEAGYTMDQGTGTLSPDDYVELFKMVISWEEFESSNFVSLYKQFHGDYINEIEDAYKENLI